MIYLPVNLPWRISDWVELAVEPAGKMRHGTFAQQEQHMARDDP